MANQEAWLETREGRLDTDERGKIKGERKYVVSLTERYEVVVWATSRQSAIDAVDEFGGNSPVSSKVTARRIKD